MGGQARTEQLSMVIRKWRERERERERGRERERETS
jgi:hypothetical protein